MVIDCFKLYDVRGIVGEAVSEENFYRIGRACAQVLGARTVVVGYDARESSPYLARAFENGVIDEGAKVIHIGLSGTEEMYFATSFYEADAGVTVTASHNPIEYNGMKFVGPGSRPLDAVAEFQKIKKVAESLNANLKTKSRGGVRPVIQDSRRAYVSKVLEFIDVSSLGPMKVVVNCGNGAAGPALREIVKQLDERKSSLEVIPVCEDPDSSFPNGIPNPILTENHHYTAEAVISENADFGVAFDGDFDRCFFFDEEGNFIPGEIMVGLLCDYFARKNVSAKIVHDPRLVFNTRSVCESAGATPIQSQTGHLFMKQAMRENEAVYGGEISAHHYFRDFFYCDSGMIPWLIIADLLGSVGGGLNSLVSAQKEKFPSSGEINFSVSNVQGVLDSIRELYQKDCLDLDCQDGLSFLFDDWRFNLRGSNTEPLLRLNVESLGNQNLLQLKIAELSEEIAKFGC